MSRELYSYCFADGIPFDEVRSSLLLALFAAEAVHGESQVRMDVHHRIDPEKRTLSIDAATAVGRDLNRVFTGFLRREFGDRAFVVRRMEQAGAAESMRSGRPLGWLHQGDRREATSRWCEQNNAREQARQQRD